MNDCVIEAAPSAYCYPLLIKQLLHSALASASDREIVYRDLKRISYREFRQRIGRLANALTELGVKPGDTVAVMDWDSHRFLECYFAVPMMGAVLHTINVRLAPEQRLYTINHAGDDIILVNAEFLPMLEEIRDRLTTVKRFVLMSDADTPPDSPLDLAGEYEELLARQPDDYRFRDFNENTRATTFYTTGTTGNPKGVYFSHRQLVLHTLGALAALGTANIQGRFHKEDVYMPITPMYHVHAWGIPYMATAMGLKQVYPGRYTPEVLLGAIRRERVTFSHCVPTILHMLLNSEAANEVDLSHWKVIVGGSALPKALCRAAINRGIDVFAGYGMSETCPLLTLAHLEPDMLDLDTHDQVEFRCKSGHPIPLVELRIVDDEMRELPHDGIATGELVVRAPWLTQGYLKDPENSAALWHGGYLHTHDLASMDQRGWVKICDRTKDVIKSGGEWLSSLDIEDILAKHPAVGEVAVIAQPDARWGERPLALVVPKPGQAERVCEEDLKALVREHATRGVISSFAVPERVLFVEALDKTSVGKVDKKALRSRFTQ
jgi:fatty-acyl-CoA synthase